MITVGNGRTDGWVGDNKIYIGRSCYGLEGSLLANPFPISNRIDRTTSIKLYSSWLVKQAIENTAAWREVLRIAQMVREDQDIELMCWCKPKACHGDILVSVINKHNQNYETK